MTTPNLCVVCNRPMADVAYACTTDALSLSESLTAAAGHAEDAWTVVARQARAGRAGGPSQPEPDNAVAEDARRNPVTAFGWHASIERPTPGGLRPSAGPADLDAAEKLHAVTNTVAGWARDLGHEPATLAEGCLWLAANVDQLRRHPAADEAFKDLHAACDQLVRLVDRPADKDLVGMCDCGKVLYAARGKTVVTCPVPTCKLGWDVAQSRDILRKSLDGKLVTAAEAARLGSYLDTDRNQQQIRKLINTWHSRRQLFAHGHITEDDGFDEDGQAKTRTVPTFRFGDVSERLARAPRRAAARAADDERMSA
jgi:hypothetical protein